MREGRNKLYVPRPTESSMENRGQGDIPTANGCSDLQRQGGEFGRPIGHRLVQWELFI